MNFKKTLITLAASAMSLSMMTEPYFTSENTSFTGNIASAATSTASPVHTEENSIDLSDSMFFPPVFHQGNLNSCVAVATTYYQFTYEARKALYEKDNTADINFTYSPASIYSLINKGINGGSREYKAYKILKNRGALTLDEMPYDANFDIRFYVKYDQEHKNFWPVPTGLNYITEGDNVYNYLTQFGTKELDSSIYEYVDTINGSPRYRRKGKYIKPQEYIALDPKLKQYYVPVYTSDADDTAICLYWYAEYKYTTLPGDGNSLFNALKIRLDSYEGCSVYSQLDSHNCKSLITESDTDIWKAPDGSQINDIKEIENQFIDKIKGYLNEEKVVTASSNYNYDFSPFTTYKYTPSGKVIYQNVAFTPDKKTENGMLGHEFTIVGYDDTIECDINNNGDIEEGEKGAFKIVNSYGPTWSNDGYVWLMYDAVREESIVKGCPDPYIKTDTGVYTRCRAIEEAYKINVSLKDIKLVSEVDVRSYDYYNLNIENYSSSSRKIINFINDDGYIMKDEEENELKHLPLVYNGPIFTDISNLFENTINGHEYNIKVYTNNLDMWVHAIRLKDDKGNIVSQRLFNNNDNDYFWLTEYNNWTLNQTLELNLEKGDLNYNHIYDINDYNLIMDYFNAVDGITDEAEIKKVLNDRFSSLQIELLDENNDGKINDYDKKYFLSKKY